jgi:NADH-quinone oxidoreductase subunit A
MMLIPILAQATQAPPPAIGEAPAAWLPVVLLIIMGVGFAVTNVIVSGIIGPRRTGSVKSSTYESGMVPVGDTRKRFNVRFYIVAMIFLVIDVEIVFFYPWATIFGRYAADPALHARSTILLWEMIVFVVILLVAYVYAWGKGVFRWD